MIYINSESTEVIIPKYKLNTPKLLKLRNNMTNSDVLLEIEDSTPNKLVYTFSINLENMTTGEYTYIVLDEENNELSTGLMVYGTFDKNKTEYQSDNKIIIYEG